MKKRFLLTAVALTAMVACSNDDIVDVNKGNIISYHTSLDNNVVSRSEFTTLENLNQFRVTAIHDGAVYFTETVTKKDEEWTSKGFPWKDNVIDFWAYAPLSVKDSVTIDENRQTINFSPAEKTEDQVDLIVAHAAETEDNAENGVLLNFKHSLTNINVSARCRNENIKIEVLGVKLANMVKRGELTIPEANSSDEDKLIKKDDWKSPEGSTDDGVYLSMSSNTTDPIILNEEFESIMFNEDNSEAGFMILPQELEKWGGNDKNEGAYISVLCRIIVTDGENETQIYPKTKGKYAFSAAAVDANWDAGYNYNYRLTFYDENAGGGRIDPNPVYPNPEDPINDIVDSNPGEGGSVISGNTIKFDVQVDKWETEEEQDIPM